MEFLLGIITLPYLHAYSCTSIYLPLCVCQICIWMLEKYFNVFQVVLLRWHHSHLLGGSRLEYAHHQYHRQPEGFLLVFCCRQVSFCLLRRRWWLCSVLLLAEWGQWGLRLWCRTWLICSSGLICGQWNLLLWCFCMVAQSHSAFGRDNLVWCHPVQILLLKALPVAGEKKKKLQTVSFLSGISVILFLYLVQVCVE